MRIGYDSPTVDGALYVTHTHPGFDGAYAYQYTNPRHELLGSRESAWVGMYLDSKLPRIDIVGPDATKVLNTFFVNRDYAKLKKGASRHALQCDENGFIVQSGIIMREGEEHYRSYNIFPFLPEDSGFDVKWEFVPDFFIQVDGPKSLEILENTFKADLHDLRFAHNKYVKFNGYDIFVHRIGMSGALAYELHGDPAAGEDLYNRICEVGKEYDIRRLGIRQYCSSHTPGGYPNPAIHMAVPAFAQFGMYMTGSANDDFTNYLVTPYDIGWGYLVKFDHDFVGKEALMKLSEGEHKVPVTLIWNAEDVGKVVAAEITDPAMAANEGIMAFNDCNPEWFRVHADWVKDGDAIIGVASGRVIDYYSNNFMSLGFISPESAEDGKELKVLWGNNGEKQMEIRATVAKFPYYDGKYRNEKFDVEQIPHVQL